MPKRKRDDSAEVENVGHVSRASVPANDRKRLEERLFHGKKVLHRALKLAKGFERQKLGRRRKTAVQSKDEAGIKRFDVEIEALKNLDLPSTAEVYLHKTLLKDKGMSQSAIPTPKVSTGANPAQDTATANVTARLYNSNPVKEAMMEVLASIRPVIGLQSSARPSKSDISANQDKLARNELRGSVVCKDMAGNEESGLSDSGSEQEERTKDQRDGLDDLFEESPDTLVPMAGADKLADDDDFAVFNSRIASAEDNSSPEPAAGSHTGLSSQPSRAHLAVGDVSVSASPSSPSPQSRSRAATSGKRSLASAALATSSFLPSLTMGGYWSGSDSGSDAIADLSDNDIAPRKNRRGQRARQQIWEKKYGSKAKHVQEKSSKRASANARDSRDDGWDLKRGAQQEGTSRGRRHLPERKFSRGSGRSGRQDVASGGNATEVVPRAGHRGKIDNSSKPLHPSWEAAKRAKEKKLETGSFAGKKIMFD